jgi:hypothetical protein
MKSRRPTTLDLARVGAEGVISPGFVVSPLRQQVAAASVPGSATAWCTWPGSLFVAWSKCVPSRRRRTLSKVGVRRTELIQGRAAGPQGNSICATWGPSTSRHERACTLVHALRRTADGQSPIEGDSLDSCMRVAR